MMPWGPLVAELWDLDGPLAQAPVTSVALLEDGETVRWSAADVVFRGVGRGAPNRVVLRDADGTVVATVYGPPWAANGWDIAYRLDEDGILTWVDQETE